MNLCRCPYCLSTFQVNIPPDSAVWERTPLDDDGMVMWVCLECHRQGQPPVEAESLRLAGHDTSYRHGGARRS